MDSVLRAAPLADDPDARRSFSVVLPARGQGCRQYRGLEARGSRAVAMNSRHRSLATKGSRDVTARDFNPPRPLSWRGERAHVYTEYIGSACSPGS